MTKLELMNYKGKTEVIENIDLDKLDNIFSIEIEIVTGDEIATVRYKDGDIERYDPFAYSRMRDFDDGGYILYNPKYNCIDSFRKRTSTYDQLDYVYSEEEG